MKQVKLTSENDTIHVDDVKVEDGVYFKGNNKLRGFLVKDRDQYNMVFINSAEMYGSPMSLNELVFTQTDVHFFTLDGRRIVTEKELTVEDITDEMHIGFIDVYDAKGHIVKFGRDIFGAVSNVAYSFIEGKGESQKELVKKFIDLGFIKELFYCDKDRKALYAWLAE